MDQAERYSDFIIKAMMVIKQEADMLMFVNARTSMWDSCASEAIIRSMGGTFSAPDTSPLLYDRNARDYYNHKGMIGSLSPFVSERTFGILSESLNNSTPTN